MAVTLREAVEAIEGLYPPGTAMSWDRVGLVTGDPDQQVQHIRLALDPTLAVVQEAIADGADLLLTHHPLLLRGIHSVATTSAKGRIVTTAVVGDLAIYCAHTSADVADPGVCDALAEACGLTDLEPLDLDEGQQLGRIGRLAKPLPLRDFVEGLARRLPSTNVGIRVSGDPTATVCRVAVLGGSGDDRFAAVRRSGVDVYVTADLRHHPALEAREETSFGPPYLVDPGHWASEAVWLDLAARRLAEALAHLGERGTTVELSVSRLRTDPWDFVIGANADPPEHGGGS
ncbi:MAG TPA: Nif3-like dinuclear metal center hexameric protein [Dermatophilaceae bacterium]|nr:Nif3-like dinuclear metal center hexameric protein [Dermatophilaceae bacterium]